VVRDDPRVADRHAELEAGRSEAFLEDLGTPHGTFMRVVGERQLSDGDEVRIGHALFRLQFALPLSAVAADGTMVLGSSGASADGFGRLLRLGPNNTVFEARIMRGTETVIGRTGGDVLLGDDPFVSSRHAAFTSTPTGCNLRDLGSTNGCYLRLKGRVALRDGDHFMVGHHLYLFRRGKES
jgi:pSer/pThr/pTyr-binding forkhead associated (FHA) protein